MDTRSWKGSSTDGSCFLASQEFGCSWWVDWEGTLVEVQLVANAALKLCCSVTRPDGNQAPVRIMRVLDNEGLFS